MLHSGNVGRIGGPEKPLSDLGIFTHFLCEFQALWSHHLNSLNELLLLSFSRQLIDTSGVLFRLMGDNVIAVKVFQ